MAEGEEEEAGGEEEELEEDDESYSCEWWPLVLGMSGPEASAALRLAANDGVTHADEEELQLELDVELEEV